MVEGRNYGKSQFFKQMEEEMRMSRNKEIPMEPTEGYEIVEVLTNNGKSLKVRNGMVSLEKDERVVAVNEKRKEDPAIYNPENLTMVEQAFNPIKESKNKLTNSEINTLIENQSGLSIDPEVYVVNTGEAYAGVIEELAETYVKKNADYGNSFEKTLDKRGLIPAIVRMEEKMERMEKLWETEETLVKDEDIIDSAMDLANYAIMTAMWLKKKEERLFDK